MVGNWLLKSDKGVNVKYFYSVETGGIYMDKIHADIPKSAVQIPKDLYQSVYANPEPGKVVGVDKNGLPCLVDPPPVAKDEFASAERLWRSEELSGVCWIRDRHRDEQDMAKSTSLTSAQFSELLGYIQNLRDWPDAQEFPEWSRRPVRPNWIADQEQ